MRPRFVLSASYTAEELLFYIFFPFLVTHAVRIVLSASYTAKCVSIFESRMQPRFELRAKLHSKGATKGQFKHMLLKRQERGLRFV